MKNRKGKLPPLKSPSTVLRQAVINAEMPTRAVIATENPVKRFFEEYGVVDEVLLMDGCEFRGGRDQMPIVDSHDDSTVRNVIGSVREMQISGTELVGVPYFASDADAQTIARRVAEGHITDFSVSAQPLESFFVQRGSSFTTSSGTVVTGPAVVHKRWYPYNASICSTGADVYSTVQRSYTDLHRSLTQMDEALLSQLSAMGLPEGMTDPNQVLAWVVGKLGTQPEAPEMPEVENAKPEDVVAPVVEKMDVPMVDEEKPVENAAVTRSLEDINAHIKRALESDQKRRNEIQSACTLAKVERAFADELCNSGVSVEVARERIIERMATQPSGASVGADARVTSDGQDRLFSAVRDGLIQRAFRAARINAKASDNADAKDFERVNLNRLAEIVLRSQGVDTTRMSNVDIAKVAMGNREACKRFKVERAYHTTGSFANLLLDAANKTLLQAYEEAPYTWTMWARQAPSVADFKNINRIRFSESPDPEMVPERHEYKEKALSDSKETYKVEKYGALFTVSWETVVNDDLDAISRVPAMHGAACRRKVNKEVYSVLTSNPTMGDTYSLFSDSHTSGSNLSGASANPSVTTLNSSFAAMMKQYGLSTDVILSIVPKYLIVPVALSGTALELVNSVSYNAANNNEGVKNIYGVGGARPLTVIAEPVLDANSTTAWYLAADPSQIDTVEVSFLQGEESPVLEDEWDFDRDLYKYKVRQTFGVKAIDWRGLYKYAAS